MFDIEGSDIKICSVERSDTRRGEAETDIILARLKNGDSKASELLFLKYKCFEVKNTGVI